MINDEHTKIDGNYKEFLNLFGISDDRILLINKPTKFKKLLYQSARFIQESIT